MSLELTAEHVTSIIKDCLYRKEEIPTDGSLPVGVIIIEGVVGKFGFHPGRLTQHKGEILELLLQLPETFRQSKGGGWTFLNACVREDGVQWGEHRSIDELMVLGLATGQVRLGFDRPLWSVLPGGLPYFTVLDATPEGGTP
jgi:hypothetical protein